MKKTEFLTEIRGMTTEDLRTKVRELKEELFKLRFRKASGQFETPHRIKEVKRDIARVSSVLGEKQA